MGDTTGRAVPADQASIASAGELLSRLVATGRPAIPERALVVVAHPDDETLGCGALLARLRHLTLLHVTDGAPREGDAAERHGFSDLTAYAAARRRELEASLVAGEAAGARLVCFGVPDQGASLVLADLARRLRPLLAEAELVITHADEGGHPDHDACAFAVRAAAALAAREDARLPLLVEMPLYRAGRFRGAVRQRFARDGRPSVRLRLTPDERARKLLMIAAHTSQRETIADFGAADEMFRIVPPDAPSPRRRGRTLYDGYGWPMTSARFAELAQTALAELGLVARS